MDLKEVVLNYLSDNDEGMKHLITWFLNEVMQEEADQQTGAGRYRRTSSRKAYRNGRSEIWRRQGRLRRAGGMVRGGIDV